MMRFSAIILAAGSGERSGLPYNKIRHEVNGKPVIDYVFEAFKNHAACGEIILVVRDSDEKWLASRYEAFDVLITTGGASRAQSVRNGLIHASHPAVLIHDGARPYIPANLIDTILENLKTHEAVTPAVAIHDTLKRVNNGMITAHVDRTDVVWLQTPQGFSRPILTRIHENRPADDKSTCDVTLYEKMTGKKARVVAGDERNLKLTTRSDLRLLELIL